MLTGLLPMPLTLRAIFVNIQLSDFHVAAQVNENPTDLFGAGMLPITCASEIGMGWRFVPHNFFQTTVQHCGCSPQQIGLTFDLRVARQMAQEWDFCNCFIRWVQILSRIGSRIGRAIRCMDNRQTTFEEAFSNTVFA